MNLTISPRTGRILLVAAVISLMVLSITMSTPAAAQIDLSPEAPPGSENITQVFAWVAWIIAAILILAFLVGCGYIAWSWLQGRELQGFKGLGIILAACALFAAASTIVGAILW